MILEKGNKVLCVENNSTIRPLIINEVKSNRISFAQKLENGVTKKFTLKKGTFTILPNQLISEQESKNYENPQVRVGDKVQILHIWHPQSYLKKYIGDTGIVKRIAKNESEVHLAVDFGEDDYRIIGGEAVYPMFKIRGKVLGDLYLRDGSPEKVWVDKDLVRIVPETIVEQKEKEISPDLQLGDRIMAWGITPDDTPPGHLRGEDEYEPPSTFIATVISVCEDCYDPRYENGIKYVVRIDDTGEEVGLYGGEWAGGSMHPIRNMYQKDTRDKWIKLPKLGITEETDVFGQGLMDPIEPEEFEGTDEDWEELISGIEEPKDEPEYEYEGGKTDPEKGFVAPSKEVTDNICQVKGFCEAQGPITFGQLKELVEEATSKRIQADMGRGAFKTLWRIVPFFVPQILLPAIGVTITRAINKLVTPALKDTRGYKEWWGKVVLKAMDIAEGDYIPDLAMGDDPISKVFFISDGLLQMIKDKYKLKFARYVADVAASKPDDEPVPDWFVDNLLRDYLNQKFLLDPPLPIRQSTSELEGIELKEQTEVEVVDDSIGGLDKAGGYVENRKFTPQECKILKLLSNRFEFDELQKLVNVDSHALSGEFQDKWGDTMKLIGEPLGSEEAWGKSLRWAAWIMDNYDYVSSTGDGFCDIEKPLIRYPSMYEIEGNDSGWERIYRSGYIEVPAFDEDDAYDRAENHWFDYEPDMETSDYGDYESDDDLELEKPRHTKTLREQQLPFNPDNKNIERDHPKGEPDWSIRRGRQHYAMNVEDTKNEPVSALNNYLVKNSPFNFLGFDYYLTAVPGRMPNQANVDIFVPMLDTGYNADKLWTTRFSPVVNLDIHDDEGPYLESTIEFLHQIRADEKWPEYYMYDEVRDEFPDQVKAYEERESDYINYPGAVYNNSWKKREDLLENELVELGKLFGVEGILINRQPFYPWKRKKDSYGNEDIRPGETVPREYPRPIKEQEDKESEFKQVVQDVVYSVYPHIIENLGVPDEGSPGVELWEDIYARLSGIKDMRGEASDTSKAEYVDEDNMIYIYYPNMENVEDIIRSLLHEYTHSLQDPDRTAQRAGGYDYDPNEIEATEAESNWKDYLVYVQEDLFEQSTGEEPIFTKRFLTILNYFMTMNDRTHSGNRADKFIGAFRREFPQVQNWLPAWLWMVLIHNKNISGLSTIQDTVTGIKPEDWEFPSIWEYEISYWDEGYEGEDEEECDTDTGRGEMTYEECEDCIRAVKEWEDEDGYLEEEECDEDEHPDYNDEDCRCVEYERRRYTVWYNQTRHVEFLTLQPLENTNDSGYTYGYDTWDEVDMDIDYDRTIITKDQEDTDYEQEHYEEYNLEEEGEIIGVDADEYDSSQVKKYMRNLVGWVLGTKDPQENLTEQFDMLSPKEMKIKDLTPQIFRVLDDNFSIEPNPEGDLNYTGEPMALYSYENRSFVPMEDIFNPINQMIDGGIPQEDIEVFVEIITNWINYNMSSPSETLNENVVINDDSGNYTEEDFSPFIDFVIEELGIETPIDVIIQSHIPNGTTAKYTKEPEDKIKVTVKNDGRKLVDMLRSIAHELVHHRQNEIGKVDYYEDKLGGIPNIGGEIEDEANAVAGQLIKKYAELQPGIYNESLIKEEKVVGFNEPSNNFVVIAGGPGAGKSFITKNLINLDNVKDFNVDQVRVMTAKKIWGDKWEENISTDAGYQKILDMTYTTSDPRNLTVKFLKQFLQQERNQPVNVVYDAGGGQEQVMKDVHQIAKDAGFNTTLVYVRTPLDVAQQRNQQRPRSLPSDMVAQYHQKVKDNMRNMIPIFDNVWTVDNKEVIDLSSRPSDNIEKIK